MQYTKITIAGIPAIVWGKPSDKVFLHVHGKMSRKEYAEHFACIAESKGWQTLSFDLPEHGERTDKEHRCDVWNGMRDLHAVADYAFAQWQKVALYACSLGAYFALQTYADRKLEKCLFQSPIVDMRWLVEHMMLWSGVTAAQLQQKKEIETPIDLLRWDYYQYILTHPVTAWPHPTRILFAGKDNLQPETSICVFAEKFHAEVTVSAKSQHPFMEAEDVPIVERWLRENL